MSNRQITWSGNSTTVRAQWHLQPHWDSASRFPCRDPSPPWLHVFLGISFHGYWKWDCVLDLVLSLNVIVYGNAGFCTWIFYPETLLKSFIGFRSLLAESLGFSRYRIILAVKRDSLTSFPIWMPFMVYSCLITLARTFQDFICLEGDRHISVSYSFIYLRWRVALSSRLECSGAILIHCNISLPQPPPSGFK